MSATHQVITDHLARAQQRYQDEVAAAMARLRAAQRSAQRQCGAEPGHLFAAIGVTGSQGRPVLRCVHCEVLRSEVTGATPNQPPREIDHEELPRHRDPGFRRHVALCLRRW